MKRALRSSAVVVALSSAWIPALTAQADPRAADAADWPVVESVEAQPLAAQIVRLMEALDAIGQPLPAETRRTLERLMKSTDAAEVTAGVQRALDPLCCAAIVLEQGAAARVIPRSGRTEIVEQGWRSLLVKVANRAEHAARLRVSSPQAGPLAHAPADQVDARWLGVAMYDGRPLSPRLSGLPLEYRVVDVYSRDAGEKSALLRFMAAIPARDDPAGDEPAVLREWRFEKGTDGWKEMNQCRIEARDGWLDVDASGNDPYLGTVLEKTARPGKMVVRFWAKAEHDSFGQLFWWTKERPQPDGRHLAQFRVEGGREQLYEVPFDCEGELVGIRLDPSSRPGRVRIGWIELAYADREGGWGQAAVDFLARPAAKVVFRVTDGDQAHAMAAFEITDLHGRVYPAQSKRLAPDFFFHRQIYRGTGESVLLPPGKYTVRCSRGPESIPETRELVVPPEAVGGSPVALAYDVKRWIDPAIHGYWSGDHHIHAAGCAHYENPTQGVHPPDMMRHCLGEDLKVGCCLTWGPCFDYQKRFFTGRPDDVSRYPYLLRYDVEVSGFGSHASGHLNLLRLREQIYPGGDSKDHWPTLGLNTLRWAKKQGAVCGPAHSSIGLTQFVGRLPGTEGKDGPFGLPNYNLPAFNGIGANEFIMNVTHTLPGPDGEPLPAVDFISTMNTDRVAEFNIWYHVLNCGFRVRASGETDFPCVSGERVGMGRVYAKVDGKLDFDRYCDAIADGRSYVSDGTAHLINFTAAAGGATLGVGERMAGTEASEGTLLPASEMRVPAGPATFRVLAAARRGDRKEVPVELVVNGYPVATQLLPADGTAHELTFDTTLEKSSWVAVRIFPHAHSNPFFLLVRGTPIRASRLSAEWCLRGVEQCWASKLPTYRAEEREQAQKDYDHARDVYRRILAETP